MKLPFVSRKYHEKELSKKDLIIAMKDSRINELNQLYVKSKEQKENINQIGISGVRLEQFKSTTNEEIESLIKSIKNKVK